MTGLDVFMNVHAYRKGLEYGFTEIAFYQRGWFRRPEWLDREELNFGDTSRYGNYNIITLGHGPNQMWAYGMSCTYGVGGCSWGLSVYDKKFSSREEALKFALNNLRK